LSLIYDTKAVTEGNNQANEAALLGGGLDEAPFAYKNIDEVMQPQLHLVEAVGKFIPKIVKMN
jgi:tRNA-splicing ligase RtcB